MKLVIGNKKYSSWSLRPWIIMKTYEIPFEEQLLMLYGPQAKDELLKWSPSAKVPLLIDGKLKIWESLAICEYLAEAVPNHPWWPKDLQARALARAYACEMHAGFATLRNSLPMNCDAKQVFDRYSPLLVSDIERIRAIWNECLSSSGGPFLFGEFGIIDAMFAPVVLRFEGYGIEVAPAERAYMDAILALPAMREWVAAGKAESYVHAPYQV